MKRISVLTCVIFVLAAIGLSVTATFIVMRTLSPASAVKATPRPASVGNVQTSESMDDISKKIAELDEILASPGGVRESVIRVPVGDTPFF